MKAKHRKLEAISMEDQTETLNPSQSAFPMFPPHRRRPLRSNTIRTLARILSHCTANFPEHQTQDDSGDAEPRPVSEQNGSIIHDQASSEDILATPSNSKEFKDTLVKETCTGNSKDNDGFQDGGFDGEQTTVPNLDHVNLVIVEDRTGDFAVEIGKEQEDMDTGLDINVDDFGPIEQLEVGNDFSIHDFSEAFDSCFGMDMVEPSKAGEDDTSLEESMPKEADHKLQLKEMELQKLIHSSAVDPTSCRTADGEVEEGEIFGDVWVADESVDALSQDAVSLGGTNAEMAVDMSEPSMVNIVNNENNCMQVELRTTAGQTQSFHSQNVSRDSYMNTPSGRNLPENAAENQISTTTEKGGDASKKKRRNGPSTQEGRAKKKRKEKIRRAKKDRELGVKRLKLQPVSKPKTIVYCRHYLNGRCHKGEKCIYSHDTVPLTKSKPCTHFARHACMKGDDCPFDHQLSKYPCANYASNGFCVRGSDCLFSHESSPMTPSVSQPNMKTGHPTMADKEGQLTLLKTATPKMTFQSPLSNLSSSKQTDNSGSSSANALGKYTNLFAARAVPKGISFLSNSGVSLGETSKLKHDGPSVKPSDVNDVNRETILKVPGGINSSNNISDGVPPRRPRGINFLSFAQPSLDDFSSKSFTNFLSNCHNEKGKQACSLPESVGFLKVDRLMNESTTCLEPGPLKEVNGIPLTTSQRPNFLSTDNTQLDNPIVKDGANDRCNKTSVFSNASSLVQRAVQTTLAFAAKFDPDIKAGSSLHQR